MPFVLAASVLLLVSTCSLGVSTSLFPIGVPTTTTEAIENTVAETTQPTQAPSSSTTPTIPAGTGVLITPSGIPVSLVSGENGVFQIGTPCGNTAVVRGGTPTGPVQVVIDPGHGGEADPGAVGPNGLTEATVNLRVAAEAQRVLDREGVNSVLTRTGDYTSTLGARSSLADNAAADIMVSIHHNAPTANLSTNPGTEVFVQNGSADSRRLGGLLYQHITDALSGFEEMLWSTSPDAGVLEVLNTRGSDAYGMLRNPETTTALAELAYISHRPEAELLTTTEYVQRSGRAVAAAILDYLNTPEAGTGYVDTPRVFNPARGISGSVCEDPALS